MLQIWISIFIQLLIVINAFQMRHICHRLLRIPKRFFGQGGQAARYFATKSLNEPEHWQEQWKEIKSIREKYKGIAPVDSMGAESLANTKYDTEFSVSEESMRFRTLIATMLSPQTKDQQTSDAFHNLLWMVLKEKKQEFRASALAKLPLERIEAAIQPVSFYKTKARNIQLACLKMDSEFNDDIPSNIDDLLAFKGVGPKIAYLTFEIAWGKTEGICVDTHVHRITNRLKWVDTEPIYSGGNSSIIGGGKEMKPVTSGPEKTRRQLEKWLPRERWGEINELFVGFGQTICSARSPLCDERCVSLLRDHCAHYQGRSSR